ncbi:MAG: AmmeMemoRadiSam system radical SAM enzyme [Phycisphaerae bacterium]|nr:AmmeMemoRadiSam system radical SAM enzyme [Phycisphaerae bacterium]
MAVALRTLLADNTIAAAPELVRDEGEGVVRCLACAHRCRIGEGKAGVCQVRFNSAGRLRVPGGYVAGLQVDPIEKKPFYHVYPGQEALSFGMLGCDFHCSYCQNWISSQTLRDDQAVAAPRAVTAERIVELAVQHRSPVMVSTYNEPLITADWAVEVFKLARPHGIRCGFVSNGNATPEVIEFLRPWADLYKVDLKCYNDRNYHKLGGTLQAVLDTISRLKERGFWVEVVTLVVPGFNDSEQELGAIARFLVGVSPEIPWHVTAFHPDYKMTDSPRTPPSTLLRAWELGRAAGLKFVYAGNLPGSVGDGENTRCPACGGLLVKRYGFQVEANHVRAGRCPKCGTAVPGIWADGPERSSGGQSRPRSVPL